MINLNLILVSFAIQTQDIPPPPDDYGPDGAQLPIDSEIWILLVAGLLLGLYVIYKRYRFTNKPA